MELIDITFEGPTISDTKLLSLLPQEYSDTLAHINGFIQFFGGLHIRGICTEPIWHSLEEVWKGGHALHILFPAIVPSDIPFGQDALGDQYILREDKVHRLEAEIGELTNLNITFLEFLEQSQQDPIGYLQLQPMLSFFHQENTLNPGELIDVYPPFCVQESRTDISLRAIPVFERIHYLAYLADQIRQSPDGTQIRLKPDGPM